MTVNELGKRIDVARNIIKADMCIKNANVVNVFDATVTKADIAIVDGLIAGIGEYSGELEIDANGAYAIPGLIDSHIHIESAFVTPEEIGRLLTAHGTTTIIADPHEIVNVKGRDGLEYMLEAAKHTALSVKYMLPSCVPCTPFEHAGAIIDAEEIEKLISNDDILGLAEYMNVPGVLYKSDNDLGKICAAANVNKPIDGHAPALSGDDLNAYLLTGVRTDHECSTKEEMLEKLKKGMYVLLRQGSACHDLERLAQFVTSYNSRRCLLCSDDRQPKTIIEKGHLEEHLKICLKNNIDVFNAVQMATINAAECFGLNDRGAITPGRRADIALVKDLNDFENVCTIIEGKVVARNGKYILPYEKASLEKVGSSIHIGDFNEDKLKLSLKSNNVKTIDIIPGGVVTGVKTCTVELDNNGDFVFDEKKDVCKIAVVERHADTGNVASALLSGYGIKHGAVAITVAHDSHNIIVVGTNNHDMAIAVEEIKNMGGGAVLIKAGRVIDEMPLPVGGLMSDQSGEWVDEKLNALHEAAYKELEVSREVEPLMTLVFMSLPVIPSLKITDMGLFDVDKFEFTTVEV